MEVPTSNATKESLANIVEPGVQKYNKHHEIFKYYPHQDHLLLLKLLWPAGWTVGLSPPNTNLISVAMSPKIFPQPAPSSTPSLSSLGTFQSSLSSTAPLSVTFASSQAVAPFHVVMLIFVLCWRCYCCCWVLFTWCCFCLILLLLLLVRIQVILFVADIVFAVVCTYSGKVFSAAFYCCSWCPFKWCCFSMTSCDKGTLLDFYESIQTTYGWPIILTACAKSEQVNNWKPKDILHVEQMAA